MRRRALGCIDCTFRSASLDLALAEAHMVSRDWGAGSGVTFFLEAHDASCAPAQCWYGVTESLAWSEYRENEKPAGQTTLTLDVRGSNGGVLPPGTMHVRTGISGETGGPNWDQSKCDPGWSNEPWCSPGAVAGGEMEADANRYPGRGTGAGTGSYAAEGTISSITATVDSALPAAPTELAAASVSRSEIQLKWVDNATDESAYRVEQSPSRTDEWSTVPAASALPGDTTPYTDTELTPGTTYHYRTVAINQYGSSTSGNASATTDRNARPTVLIGGEGHGAREGETKTFTGYADDGDGDELTYLWEICSGRAEIVSAPAAHEVVVFFPDGKETVILSLEVFDGFQESRSLYQTEIANVVPVATISGTSEPEVDEPTAYTYTVRDPGDDDVTAEPSCGGDSKSNASATSDGGSFTCTFATTQATTVTVESVDYSDGAAAQPAELPVTPRETTPPPSGEEPPPPSGEEPPPPSGEEPPPPSGEEPPPPSGEEPPPPSGGRDPQESGEEDPNDAGDVSVRSTVSLRYVRKLGLFKGTVTADDEVCVVARNIKILRVREGRDREVATARSDEDGRWRARGFWKLRPGSYYARVAGSVSTTPEAETTCLRGRSASVHLQETG